MDARAEPFLLAFFEPVPDSESGSRGTETFTKTAGESGDTDAGDEPGRDGGEPLAEREAQRRAVVLGTETRTAQRTESTDDDEPRSGTPLWGGRIL
jgi:hypothetical protein